MSSEQRDPNIEMPAEKIVSVLRQQLETKPAEGADKVQIGNWLTVVVQYADAARPAIERRGDLTELNREIGDFSGQIRAVLESSRPIPPKIVDLGERLARGIVAGLEHSPADDVAAA